MNSTIGVREAARRLNISERRVRQLIDDGILPAAHIGEGRRKTWLIDPADLPKADARPKKNSGPKRKEVPSDQ